MPARKRQWRPDDAYLLRGVADAQISPDGAQVAYVVGTPDRESDTVKTQIWLGTRPLTAGGKDSAPRWSPDGRSLAFVSDRGSGPQIYVLSLEGGEPRALTTAESGAAQPTWSPDGRRIAYVARTGAWTAPDKRTPAERNAPVVVKNLQFRLDGAGLFDARRHHVFVVDVESERSLQLTSGDGDDHQPTWSPDGRTIAYVSDRERARHDRLWRADVWVAPSAGGRARKITRSRGGAAYPSFSPDGRTIAYVGHEDGDEAYARNKHVLVVSSRGGAPRSISASLDRSAAGWPLALAGNPLSWTRSGDGVLFTAYDRGSLLLFRASPSGRVKPVVTGDRQVDSFSVSRDGRTIAYVASWLDEPAEVYLDGRRVSDANGELRRTVDLAKVRRVSHTSPDGLEIESFVVLPKTGRKPFPTVLEIHGGPHGAHPNALALASYQSLAARGYTVLLPNPRGSTSYGEAFTMACVRDWGGGDFDDLMRAVDALVDKGIADADRLVVGGYSYGGFMTSWTIGHTNRFRAAVVGAPVADLVSMFGTSDVPLFSRYELGGTPWEVPEEYRKRSPLTYLPDVRTPVLLTHWDGDLRCPPGQSEQIFASLKLLGREVVLLRYPGGSHGIRTPSQNVDRIRRVIDWYDSHTTTKGAKRARPKG